CGKSPVGHAQGLRRTRRTEGASDVTPGLLMQQAGAASGSATGTAPGSGPGLAARPADPCSFGIFCASGDMARRLRVPALYNLAVGGLLPDAFAIIGVARGDKSEEEFRAGLESGLRQFAIGRINDDVMGRLLSCVAYVGGDADDPATYSK